MFEADRDLYNSNMANNPKIVTSCWFTRLPGDHIKFGISRGTPRGMAAGYRKYPKLNPGKWFNSVSPTQYKQLYYDEVLNRLDPQRVVNELVQFADGKVPVLVCYEKPDDNQWCHRGLVSVWLKETIDLEVLELGLEDCGCGYSHPKLHPTQVPREALAPSVPDRANEIAPHVNKMFRDGKRVWQVRGPSKEFPDQVAIWDGKREMTITVDTMLKKLGVSA